MAVGDLTTLANVKNWRTPVITGTTDDAQVSREITAASRAILQVLQRRSLAATTYAENRNGQNTSGIMLKNYPVIGITSVSVDGLAIPASTTPSTSGWVYSTDDGMLYLRGCYTFTPGFQNVSVVYTAGYQYSDVNLAINPASNQIACSSLTELWASDMGVSYASSGASLVAVQANPIPGQYVAPLGPDGFYQFNVGDQTQTMNVLYGYTPRDVEEACIDTVILEYNRRGRIGENSKVLAGENVNYYNNAAFTRTIESRLQSYMNVVPNV